MRHAVLGAGGDGGLVGGALAKAGQPVTVLVRPGRRDHYPERLTVQSDMLGTFEAPVQVAPRPATRARAEALCEELRGAGLGCEVREDEVTMLWSKLCFLAPFALATTASGRSLEVVRSDAQWRALLEECVNETCAVGVAEGAKVAPEPILAAFEGAPDGFRSSMQRDVAVGRPPEVEAIAGPILRGGTEHGIDVSATRALLEQIVTLE